MTGPVRIQLPRRKGDAPERIWATVNGSSTRLPDGGWQLIGGWSEDASRPRVTEYVRADLHDALTEERDRLKADIRRISEEHARIIELNKAHCRTVNSYILDNSRRDDALKAAEAERDRLAAEVGCLKEALTPSDKTKAAYAEEFYMGVTLRTHREEDYRRIQIPWDSIKAIMAAISARALLTKHKATRTEREGE